MIELSRHFELEVGIMSTQTEAQSTAPFYSVQVTTFSITQS